MIEAEKNNQINQMIRKFKAKMDSFENKSNIEKSQKLLFFYKFDPEKEIKVHK